MNVRAVAFPLLAVGIVAALYFSRPTRSEAPPEPTPTGEEKNKSDASEPREFSWLRPVQVVSPAEPVLRAGPIQDVVERCLSIANWQPLAQRTEALERLGALEDPAAIHRLVSRVDGLWRENPERAYIFLPVLGQLRDPQGAAIVQEAAVHSRAMIRQEAARALGLVDDAAAASRLEKLAEDPDEAVRSSAIRSLIEMHCPEALSALIRYAERDPNERMKHVLFRLGQDSENPSGIPTLRKYLDEQGPLSLVALRMLVRLGDLSAMDRVYRMLELGNEKDEFDALNIVRETRPEMLDLSRIETTLESDLADARMAGCDAIFRMAKANLVTEPERVGELLEKRLSDRDYKVRAVAVSALAALGRKDITEPYVKLAATVSGVELHSALDYAVTFGKDHRIVPVLLERLRATPAPSVADQARMISALGVLDDPASIEAYLRWIRDARPDEELDASGISLSKRAALHVSTLGPGIQPDLLAVVTDRTAHPAARLRALDAIRGISGSTCFKELIEIASDEEQPIEVRIAAVDSLPTLKGIDYFEALEDALDDFDDRTLRLHATYVLLTNAS